MDAPSRFPGQSNLNINRPAAPASASKSEKKFEFISEDPKKKIESTKERIKRLHPDRTCAECLKNNQEFYKNTAEWRRFKDRNGEPINDASGKAVWLCNKHGLAQDRAIRKANDVAQNITRKRMSVDSLMNPALKEDEAAHIRKKMSVDSLLDESK